MTEQQLKRKRCPRCRKAGRLLLGPFYDRLKIRCQECGFHFRLKES